MGGSTPGRIYLFHEFVTDSPKEELGLKTGEGEGLVGIMEVANDGALVKTEGVSAAVGHEGHGKVP